MRVIRETAVERAPGSQAPGPQGFPTAAQFTIRVTTCVFPSAWIHKDWVADSRLTSLLGSCVVPACRTCYARHRRGTRWPVFCENSLIDDLRDAGNSLDSDGVTIGPGESVSA